MNNTLCSSSSRPVVGLFEIRDAKASFEFNKIYCFAATINIQMNISRTHRSSDTLSHVCEWTFRFIMQKYVEKCILCKEERDMCDRSRGYRIYIYFCTWKYLRYRGERGIGGERKKIAFKLLFSLCWFMMDEADTLFRLIVWFFFLFCVFQGVVYSHNII